MEQTSGIAALRKAVAHFKTQTGLARAISKPQSSINEVLKSHRKKIPAEWCIEIERATNGKVTRSQLRPDLYPEEA